MYSSRAILRASRAIGAPRFTTTRTFTVASRMMAEGDTGAPRSGGVAHGDTFTKREQANENMYIRDQEKQKLAQLKKRLEEHKEHLKELEKHVDDLTTEQNQRSGA
ncbi:MAG: hypothetical protein M1820_006259 [Bogoriella megaspora]|nr:MAG: hypothetical protein M1820_006259 [Bogoriella megaspora]